MKNFLTQTELRITYGVKRIMYLFHRTESAFKLLGEIMNPFKFFARFLKKKNQVQELFGLPVSSGPYADQISSHFLSPEGHRIHFCATFYKQVRNKNGSSKIERRIQINYWNYSLVEGWEKSIPVA